MPKIISEEEKLQYLPSSIQTIVFDLDGTLVELVDEDVFDGIFRLAARAGINKNREEFFHIYSNTVRDWENSSVDQHNRNSYVELWRTVYDNAGLSKATAQRLAIDTQGKVERLKDRIFSDAIPALKLLSKNGYDMGIFSERARHGISASLRRHRLDRFIKFVFSAQDAGAEGGKKNISVWNELIRMTGCDTNSLLYVGDGYEYDVRQAARLGFNAALIDRTKSARPGIKGGVMVLTTLEQVPQILARKSPP